MKILHIHAHFDDFEFVAAGTFELWRRKLGADLHARVLVCTDGKAGHHFRSREETMCLRLEEQEASARIGQYEFKLLRLPNGEVPRDGCLIVNTPLPIAGNILSKAKPQFLEIKRISQSDTSEGFLKI